MVRLSRFAPHGRAGCDPRCSNGALTREGSGGGVRLWLVHILKGQLLLQWQRKSKAYNYQNSKRAKNKHNHYLSLKQLPIVYNTVDPELIL